VNLAWDKAELESISDQVEGFDVGDFGFDIEDLPQVTFPGEKTERTFDDPNDMSDKIEVGYKVEIDCEDENQQEQLFNELKERGLKCRILTL
jgi:hypothetical protein